MNEPPSPLASSLIGALRSAVVEPDQERLVKQRVQARLGVALLGLTPALGSSVSATHASTAAGKAALAVKSGALSKAMLAAWLAPVFAAGFLSGVVVDQAHTRRAVTPASKLAPARTQPSVAPPAQPEPAQEPSLSPENLELILEKRAPSTPAMSAEPATSLAAERRLLDEARHALARGEPASGLAPLATHSKRFPRGVLTEEREALAVRLLAAQGNRAAALARADSFHRRFPQSMFTPAVDNAVAPLSSRNVDSETE
jgi:hypothetical protein